MAKIAYAYRDHFTVGVFLALALTLYGLYASSGGYDIVLALFFVVWLWGFYKVTTAPPGSVPHAPEWTTCPDYSLIQTRDSEGNVRYCEITGQFMPDRSHFDKRSKRVIPKFDHFCPWLGQAIGNGNYRYFHQLLIYSVLCSSLLIYDFTRNLIVKYQDQTLPWGNLYLQFLGFVLGLLVMLNASALACMHTYFLCHNITMIEWMKNEDLTRWDTGSIWQNILQVYPRNNLLAWIIPINSHAHHGLYYTEGYQKSQCALAREDTVQLLSEPGQEV